MPPPGITLICLRCDTTWVTWYRDWSDTGERCWQCNETDHVSTYNSLVHDTYVPSPNRSAG